MTTIEIKTKLATNHLRELWSIAESTRVKYENALRIYDDALDEHSRHIYELTKNPRGTDK